MEPTVGSAGALLEQSLAKALDDLAEGHVAGASGSSAALVGATAAALTAMVARGASSRWDGAGGALAQAEALRARLCTLAAADIDAHTHARSLLYGHQ